MNKILSKISTLVLGSLIILNSSLFANDEFKTFGSANNDFPYLGETRTFHSSNLDNRMVTATCQAIGNHCYVFVEDSVWGIPGNITQKDLDDLIVAFDSKTSGESIDSTKGIFQLETELFGPIPDRYDNDPKFYILFLRHSYSNGYFVSINEYEMFYIAADVNSRWENQRPDYHLHVAAHEFFHLIHSGQSSYHDAFLGEGCAELATFLCGYYEPGLNDTISYHYLAKHSNLSVNGFSRSRMCYPLAFTFMLYLYEKYGGITTICEMIAKSTNSISAINQTLASRGYTENFADILVQWQLAIYLDHQDSPEYGFEKIDIPPFSHTHDHKDYHLPGQSETVNGYAGQFIGFKSKNGATLTFQGNRDLRLTAIHQKENEIVTIEPDYDANYKATYELAGMDSITILVSNVSSNSITYNYNAVGATSGVSTFVNNSPTSFCLYQNYPNPFNPSTTIRFTLQKSEQVSLEIFNLAGQEVATLVNEVCLAGEHQVQWQADGLPGGIYFCRLQLGKNSQIKKLILQK